MKISLPHIGYNVLVKDIAKYKWKYGEEQLKEKSAMFVEDAAADTSIMWITYPITHKDFPRLAHETTHVLDNICKVHQMDFNQEVEHMAYIMEYILASILANKNNKK